MEASMPVLASSVNGALKENDPAVAPEASVRKADAHKEIRLRYFMRS